MSAREELQRELGDLISRYGLVPVVDVLGVLCSQRAHRIGDALRAQREAAGGFVKAFLRGIREGVGGREGE
jgi:hypothetical protein